MTHGDFKHELLVRLQRGVTSVSMEPAAADTILNMAYQWIYPYSLKQFPWMYVKSQAFAAVTSIPLAADFNGIVGINVPTAFTGQARIASYREGPYLGQIAIEAGSAANPLAVLNQTAITIAPSSTGTLYYFFKFADVTNDATEITAFGGASVALIHPAYEGMIMTQAMILARMRHMQAAGLNGEQQMLQIQAITQQQNEQIQRLKPLEQWRQEIAEG